MSLLECKISKLLLVVFCIVNIGSCTSPPGSRENIPGEKAKDDHGNIIKENNVLYDLVYEGILPCKDCGGIKTTLKLSTRSNKFNLREEFLDTKISPSVLIGNFNTERGFEKDEDATLYVLNDELPDSEHLYFLRETEKNEILVKLNNDRQKSDHRYFELKKVSRPEKN
jgi:hypothetical protein